MVKPPLPPSKLLERSRPPRRHDLWGALVEIAHTRRPMLASVCGLPTVRQGPARAFSSGQIPESSAGLAQRAFPAVQWRAATVDRVLQCFRWLVSSWDAELEYWGSPAPAFIGVGLLPRGTFALTCCCKSVR